MGASFGNDMKLVKFTLSYASTITYRNMVQEGKLDEVLQKPPGGSYVLAREGEASQQPSERPQPPPTKNGLKNVSIKVVHITSTCVHCLAITNEAITRNRTKRPNGFKDQPNHLSSNSSQMTQI